MQLLARERLLGISQFDADEFAITADRFKHLYGMKFMTKTKDLSTCYCVSRTDCLQ